MMLRLIFSFLLLVPGLAGVAQSHYPGQHAARLKLKDKFLPAVQAFDLQEITLLPSRFTENRQREEKWLLSIPVISLLHSFRTNAGVYSGYEGGYSPTKGVPKLAGWESLDCELRGHSTGHILSGLALLYGSTGQQVFKLKADSIVNGLAEVQQALGQNGYLSAFPQELINRNIEGKRVWAPWYTLHKLYAGLIDQYLYCNNEKALEIVSMMGEWAYQKLYPLSAAQRTVMLRNEFGGMSDAFYNLYAITCNEHFKWVAGFFYHNEVLDPLKEKRDILSPKHANTYIPKLIGLARDYELEGSGDGMSIADFFWNTVIRHHTYATGSNSDKEHFFTPDKISEHLTGYTGESCNVYNMLKLTRHLYIWKADVKYAEYYEQALLNHILGQQDPATGMIAYFLPMLAGAHKLYSTPDSSFWCCVGSGFENQAKYGEAIYYHNQNNLFVNLFIPSVLNWKAYGTTLEQQTAFPQNGVIQFTVVKAGDSPINIHIRYPSWTSKAILRVNGKAQPVKTRNGYIIVERNWKKGDRVEVVYDLSLRLIEANDNNKKVAIAYGPIVLAAEMGTRNMTGRAPYSDPTLHNDYYTYDFKVPDDIRQSLGIDRNNLPATISKMNGEKLSFKIPREGVVLRPLFDIHRERYVVYWDLNN